MIERRSFFKSLALIGAAAVGCPGVFIPKFERGIWKPRRMVSIVNPEWVDAPFGMVYNEQAYPTNELFGRWKFEVGTQPEAVRFVFERGKYREVRHYINV